MRTSVYVVSGAGGFIGEELVRRLAEQGQQVRALVRRVPSAPIPGVDYFPFDLMGPAPVEAFSDGSFFIHAAFIKPRVDDDAIAANREGTERLLTAAHRQGIKKSLYFSSLSAREDAISAYGKSKFEIETLFQGTHDLVFRPGLVLGRKGLFADIEQLIARSRLIPMIDGGRQPIQTLHIDDLVAAVFKALNEDLSGTFRIAEVHAVPIRELYLAVAGRLKRKTVFVPFPSRLALPILDLSSMLKVQLPVSKDNLLGLMRSTPCDVRDDLRALGVSPRSFQESLRDLAG